MNERMEILLATCNGALFLREQLDSILSQTDENWHLTISDDGSEDGTKEIIRKYTDLYPNKIQQQVSGRHFGNARDHFFYLADTCDARWMMFCDQDDTWAPEKVERFRAASPVAETHDGTEMPLLIFCDQTPTDQKLKPLAASLMRYQKQYFKEFDYRSILFQNVVTGGAMAVNRSLVRLATEHIQNPNGIIMHDWWLAAVAARFGKILYIDEPLGTYRQHDMNAVGAKHVGSISYSRDRIGKLDKVRESIRRKKTQAACFRDTYRERLTEEDLLFLNAFEKKRSGIGFYLKYGKWIHGMERKIGMALLG